eukprot:CAMPEP_0118995980 /NCGR_PEP_ID=MMETSP1173-20130426/59325_1 /TAXON_ID=1034831 /ORGANISM="Rhizochromulina marina cf, Strain CCMP1243" /LENGTH=47 /DNA_ID= /DNA_START= /DNA_END= /DNA_ORIENTATION=
MRSSSWFCRRTSTSFEATAKTLSGTRLSRGRSDANVFRGVKARPSDS